MKKFNEFEAKIIEEGVKLYIKSIGTIKSIIPVYKGYVLGNCYFFDVNGLLIRIVHHGR